MERVTQEDKEEVAIFLKEYSKINNKFIKIKFISNNLKFKTYISNEEKDRDGSGNLNNSYKWYSAPQMML